MGIRWVKILRVLAVNMGAMLLSQFKDVLIHTLATDFSVSGHTMEFPQVSLHG